MKTTNLALVTSRVYRVSRRITFGVAAFFSIMLLAVFSASAADERVVFSNSIAELPATIAATKKTLAATNLTGTMNFAIALQMRNRAELDARIAHGEQISRAEMDRLYLPLQSEYDAIKLWLAGQGFTLLEDDSSRLSVFARGTTQQIQSSLQTNIVSVTSKGVDYLAANSAPSLPATISSPVLGINGLQPYRQKRKHSIRPQTANKPPFLINEILGAFNAKNLGVTGTGQTIAILIDTVPRTADLTAFYSANSVTRTGTYTTINVNNLTLPVPEGEESLDVEWTAGIAPGANIRVYATGTLSDANLDAGLARIINELGTYPIHQLSISLGANESDSSSSQITTDSNYFATLASQGVSTFVSSGDDGSTPDGNGGNTGALGVEYYSSDLSVTSVGGTALTLVSGTGARSSETAWSGSGGGISSLFAKPSWQTGTGVPSGTKRYVPDVSLPADPNTGAYVYLNGNVQTIGGTSWSAPTWAGFCALINQARANNSKPSLGLLNPYVYPLIGTTNFYDITSGSNAIGSLAGGKYSATTGYDQVTGVGSPNMGVLLTTLANQATSTAPTISSFTPTSGLVGTSVTINGTNFTTVTAVKFNGVSATTYTVNSATKITATVPTGATTGTISVTASGGTGTSTTSFTVTTSSSPTITSFTPSSGTVGTSVVITGTNLSTVSSITLNGVSVTSYTINSATQITAIVPAGATTGLFSVTAPAGSTSSSTSFTVTTASTPGGLVISQVYGGAGTGTTSYKYDYIELFNPGTSSVSLGSYSVQYSSATGSTWSKTNLPSGAVILAQHYYLIQEAGTSTTAADLPTPDATGTIGMSTTNGKVALVSNQTAITSRTSTGVVDYVGYGTTANDFEGTGPVSPSLSATTAALRNNGGYTDSNSNDSDFTVGTPNPRNSTISNVVGTPVPDLTITKTHSGSFTQADVGDTYTITVSNGGTGGTSGTVTVTDTLPAGLTATALSGTGWTTNLGALTCTRTDLLASGTSYPPITVTVSVSSTAASSVTNTATVSGGGESTTSNDSASDVTSINAITPSQRWRYQYFGTTTNAGSAADANIYANDGLTNLLKYALNLNPLTPAVNPSTIDTTTGFLRLTIPRNPLATDITYTVEINNTDLTSTTYWTTTGTVTDQNTTSLLQVHDGTAISGSPKQFIRLRVARP